ncbi:hypothetical protein V1478_008418 [Vespula squamosa]|uniref:Uncharacterized protein n=1 Tax=Vespula squamosa TaxID=30214 RepID=A0ABD2AW48_VESSQ
MLCGLSYRHEEQTRAYSFNPLFKAPPTTSHVAEGSYPACYCCRGGHCIAVSNLIRILRVERSRVEREQNLNLSIIKALRKQERLGDKYTYKNACDKCAFKFFSLIYKQDLNFSVIKNKHSFE